MNKKSCVLRVKIVKRFLACGHLRLPYRSKIRQVCIHALLSRGLEAMEPMCDIYGFEPEYPFSHRLTIHNLWASEAYLPKGLHRDLEHAHKCQ